MTQSNHKPLQPSLETSLPTSVSHSIYLIPCPHILYQSLYLTQSTWFPVHILSTNLCISLNLLDSLSTYSLPTSVSHSIYLIPCPHIIYQPLYLTQSTCFLVHIFSTNLCISLNLLVSLSTYSLPTSVSHSIYLFPCPHILYQPLYLTQSTCFLVHIFSTNLCISLNLLVSLSTYSLPTSVSHSIYLFPCPHIIYQPLYLTQSTCFPVHILSTNLCISLNLLVSLSTYSLPTSVSHSIYLFPCPHILYQPLYLTQSTCFLVHIFSTNLCISLNLLVSLSTYSLPTSVSHSIYLFPCPHILYQPLYLTQSTCFPVHILSTNLCISLNLLVSLSTYYLPTSVSHSIYLFPCPHILYQPLYLTQSTCFLVHIFSTNLCISLNLLVSLSTYSLPTSVSHSIYLFLCPHILYQPLYLTQSTCFPVHIFSTNLCISLNLLVSLSTYSLPTSVSHSIYLFPCPHILYQPLYLTQSTCFLVHIFSTNLCISLNLLVSLSTYSLPTSVSHSIYLFLCPHILYQPLYLTQSTCFPVHIFSTNLCISLNLLVSLSTYSLPTSVSLSIYLFPCPHILYQPLYLTQSTCFFVHIFSTNLCISLNLLVSLSTYSLPTSVSHSIYLFPCPHILYQPLYLTQSTCFPVHIFSTNLCISLNLPVSLSTYSLPTSVSHSIYLFPCPHILYQPLYLIQSTCFLVHIFSTNLCISLNLLVSLSTYSWMDPITDFSCCRFFSSFEVDI